MDEDIKNKISGEFSVFEVRGDSWELLHEQHNLITYSGADVMAKALAGDRVINGVYLAFENSDVADYVEDAGNTAATYAAEVSGRSFVRVKTLSRPIFSQSAPEYANNSVQFQGVTDGTSFFPGTPVQDGISKFYHTVLVSTLPGGDQTDDVVFSCATWSVPITKVAGANLGIRWRVKLLQ